MKTYNNVLYHKQFNVLLHIYEVSSFVWEKEAVEFCLCFCCFFFQMEKLAKDAESSCFEIDENWSLAKGPNKNKKETIESGRN